MDSSIYVKDEDKALNYGAVFDLLNSQSAIIADLEKENEQLKKENEQLKQKNMYFLKIMFALKNYIENEDYKRIEKVIDKIKKRRYKWLKLYYLLFWI